jgi:hypothetical protein
MANLEVTGLKIFISTSDKSTNIGYGSVQFCDLIWIEIGIRKMPDGRLFVTWPSYKKGDGTWTNSVKFFSDEAGDGKEALKSIEDYILSEFAKKINVTTPVKTKKESLISVKVKQSAPPAPIDQEQIVSDEIDDDDEIFNMAIGKG